MGCNTPNALNLEQLGIKILKCAFFFRYAARMPLIFGVIKIIRVIKIEVHPSSHAVSRHQIVLRFYLELQKCWCKLYQSFNWEFWLVNSVGNKSIHDQVDFLIKTILKIFVTFIY